MAGITDREEIQSNRIRREARTFIEVFIDFLGERDIAIVFAAIGICSLLLPAVGPIFFFPVLGVAWYNLSRKPGEAPLYLPKSSKMKDVAYAHPGTGKARPAEGIAFMGNEVETNREVWVPNDVLRAHLLYFATTGGGKSEGLKSFAFGGPLVQGSGYIYIDGKGENKLALSLLSMARRLGREDDFFVISFMTGNQDNSSRSTTVTTNTFNPFVYGSSAVISELIKSLLSSDSGGSNGDMWKSRAESYVDAIVRPLVYLRDAGAIQMTVGEFRDSLSLGGVAELFRKLKIVERRRRAEGAVMPRSVTNGLVSYLYTLPGMKAALVDQIINTGVLPDKLTTTVYDQHGYITMQLTPVVNMLADDYGHIFNCKQSDIDMWDIVSNRRQLVVLLPALEKSPGALSNLGKIVLAAIKSMMGMALGHYVEGDTDSLIGNRPTDASSPMAVYADEVGYYFVDGIAITAAQARSLGFSFLYAGQDYPALKRGSEKEAPSVVGNTGIKIFGKIEDEETASIAQKRLDQSWVAETAGREYDHGMAGTGIYDQKTLKYEKRERLTIRDLSKLKEGQVYIVHADKKARVDLFYADAPMLKNARLNSFVEVLPPEDDVLESVAEGGEAASRQLMEAIESGLCETEVNDGQEDNLQKFQQILKQAIDSGARLFPAAISSMVAYDRLYGSVIRSLNTPDTPTIEQAVVPEAEMPGRRRARRSMSDSEMRRRARLISGGAGANQFPQNEAETEEKMKRDQEVAKRLTAMSMRIRKKDEAGKPTPASDTTVNKEGVVDKLAGLYVGDTGGYKKESVVAAYNEAKEEVEAELEAESSPSKAEGADSGESDSERLKAAAAAYKKEHDTGDDDGEGEGDPAFEKKVDPRAASKESMAMYARARMEAKYLVRRVRENGAHPRKPHPKADKARLKATIERLKS